MLIKICTTKSENSWITYSLFYKKRAKGKREGEGGGKGGWAGGVGGGGEGRGGAGCRGSFL